MTGCQTGDYISVNGDTGEVLIGKQPLKPPAIYDQGDCADEDTDCKDTNNVVTFMQWVDAKRKLEVMANADTPADAAEARRNGAQGIGLTRTEHMFFNEDRINVVRKMILSHDPAQRKEALDKLLVFQRNDFEGLPCGCFS
jgi:pyruvate,orthophosphate dikinase